MRKALGARRTPGITSAYATQSGADHLEAAGGRFHVGSGGEDGQGVSGLGGGGERGELPPLAEPVLRDEDRADHEAESG